LRRAGRQGGRYGAGRGCWEPTVAVGESAREEEGRYMLAVVTMNDKKGRKESHDEGGRRCSEVEAYFHGPRPTMLTRVRRLLAPAASAQ
jgi:hypothetical protein